MARLIGFFALVLCALFVLRELPVIGALFRIPFVGFWLAAITVSLVATRLASLAVDRAKVRALERRLGAVETPHNQGKLGVLHASLRRHEQAVACLERAAAGEPEFTEWHYRLGISRLALRDLDGARRAFERALELCEDHAYGQALLRLCETQTRTGLGSEALAALVRFERARGPTPESAYRRGLALRLLGDGLAAKAAFDEVGTLARGLARYQQREGWRWSIRAWLARLTMLGTRG